MAPAELKAVKAILKEHYRLQGEVSTTEARHEIRNLARKSDKGSLDDRAGALAARIHTTTGRSVVELYKGAKP